MNEDIQDIVVKELDEIGFDLVEFTRKGSKSRPVFDVRMDRRDGEKVSIDDCAKASRKIEATLDAGPLAGANYVLEVSSPGMDRPVRNAAEFRRFVGRLASVNSPALDGRREVDIVAVEGEEGAEVVVLRDAKGEYRVPLAGIKEARLAFNWKR